MSKKKYLILLSIPFLASCGGFSTDYIVQGNKYNSPIFTENYYRHWDSELKKATIKDSHDVTASKIMSYSDIGLVDKNLLVENPYPYLSMYAEANNLMKADQSFNQNYLMEKQYAKDIIKNVVFNLIKLVLVFVFKRKAMNSIILQCSLKLPLITNMIVTL